MLYALKGGWYVDRREGNKKVLPEGVRQHFLLKLALDAPLSKRKWLSGRQSEAQTRGNELVY